MIRIGTDRINFNIKDITNEGESMIQCILKNDGIVILKNHDSSLYVKYDLVQRVTEAATPHFSVVSLNLFKDFKTQHGWILNGTLSEELNPGIGTRIHNVLGTNKGTGLFLTKGKFWSEL